MKKTTATATAATVATAATATAAAVATATAAPVATAAAVVNDYKKSAIPSYNGATKIINSYMGYTFAARCIDYPTFDIIYAADIVGYEYSYRANKSFFQIYNKNGVYTYSFVSYGEMVVELSYIEFECALNNARNEYKKAGEYKVFQVNDCTVLLYTF